MRFIFIFILVLFPIYAIGQNSSSVMEKAFAAVDRADNETAIKLFLEAVINPGTHGVDEAERIEANYQLFDLLAIGAFDTAIIFLETAAIEGHPAAQNHFGYLITQLYRKNPSKALQKALGGKYDRRDAIRFITTASDAGYYPAVMRLADYYEDGSNGAIQDPAYAEELYARGFALAEEAMAGGDPNAAEDIARYYERGQGTEKSLAQANRAKVAVIYLLEDQAVAGNIEAQRRLMYKLIDAEVLRISPDTQRDAEDWAIIWLVNRDDHNSMATVARLYAEGKLGGGNLVMAHALYNTASTLGETDFAATKRDEVADRMTSQQIREAQVRARKCVSLGLAGCLD
ncbi:hypothetical protein C1J05_03305 [Sulfitobacter sp. JL08]|nr:hypothetical protein C1J05_03305 [Sulfitobacter sp. JL08]